MDYFNIIAKTIEKIENDLKKDIDIDELAKEVFISKFHFHRIFKAFTSYPVITYLRKRRLNEAYKELINTKRGILEIAMDYSYYSNEAFTRAMKKETGFTPSKVRKNQKIKVGLEKLPIWKMRYEKKYNEVNLPYEILNINEFSLIGLSKEMTLEDEKNYQLVLELTKELSKKIEVKSDIKREFGIAFESSLDFKNPYNNDFIYFRGYKKEKVIKYEDHKTKKIENFKCAKFYVGSTQEDHKKYLDYIYSCWLFNVDSKYELDRKQFDFMEEIKINKKGKTEIYFYIPIKLK
ncbi:MAG: AraC family transcriptional regulator [Fusobacteriota bacterium]